MLVVEGQHLLAMSAVFRVIHIQDDHCGRLGIAGDEGLNKRLRQAIDVLASAGVLQVREDGARG